MSTRPNPGGEFVLTDTDFETVARIVHASAGIVLAQGKRQLVYSRLAKKVRKLGFPDFAPYVAFIRDDADARRDAIFALTTNHTFFFREAHHFEHFAAHVRPTLIEQAQRGRRVRLWSSASSSGEEPYSLAMTFLGEDRPAARQLLTRDVAILATDLAPHVLTTASTGRYPGDVIGDVPPALRRSWIQADKDEVVMAPELRRLVSYRQLNLLDQWPMRGTFDAIFCRNVMIYFDTPTKERLVARMVDLLEPQGFLYIGHSERVTGPAADRVEAVGQTIYRRRA